MYSKIQSQKSYVKKNKEKDLSTQQLSFLHSQYFGILRGSMTQVRVMSKENCNRSEWQGSEPSWQQAFRWSPNTLFSTIITRGLGQLLYDPVPVGHRGDKTRKNPALPRESPYHTKQQLLEPINLVLTFYLFIDTVAQDIDPSSKGKQLPYLGHFLAQNLKPMIRDKEEYLIKLKESIYQEGIKP